ncbi:MAG: hypothetical protein ACT4OE_09735 [Sphingosinicella sp.]
MTHFRRPRIAPALVVALLLALPFSASAQAPAPAAPPASAAESPIFVTGQRLSRPEARRRAVAFVQGTGIASGQTPVARWVDPVCIGVIGLSDRHAALVRNRVVRIAAAANGPVARGACPSNVGIVFTSDAGAVVREVERRAPRRLEEVRGDTRSRLLAGSAPIRWWYSTATRDPHGVRESNAPGFTGGEGSGAQGTTTTTAGSVLPGDIPTLMHYNSSMISTQAVRALIAASVVVDVDAMEGMPLEAVAAYAAMVAFAEIRENDFSSPGSILGMFAARPDAPRALTDWDMAFLRVLYRLPLDRDARMQRGILVRDLLRAIEAGS